MLKIVQIYASKGWGGGEKYVLELSHKLVAEGNQVISVSKKCPVLNAKIESKEHYYQLPMRGVADLYSGYKLARIIKREKPAVIHVHNFKDAFVAAYAKVLSGSNAKLILSRHLVKRSKTGALYTWLYGKLDKIVFVSHLAKEEFLLSKPQIKSSKIAVVHNSINTLKTEKTTDIREKYQIGKTAVILVFTGRIVDGKGLDVLLDAVEMVRELDFKLLILGAGSKEYTDKIDHKIAESGLTDKVLLVGFVDNVSSVIAQADIGILPSVLRESFGLSVIEFMEQGKVVVTTNNGAQPEFVADGVNGYLVPPSDAEAIADKLRLLISDEELRNRIGKQAMRDFTEKLSYDKFYEKIYALYKGC